MSYSAVTLSKNRIILTKRPQIIMRAACPANVIPVTFSNLMTFYEEYKLGSSTYVI